MSHKERVISAIKDLIHKYENFENPNHRFAVQAVCPLCKIYHRGYQCTGCPQARQGGSIGCSDMKTYMNMENFVDPCGRVIWAAEYDIDRVFSDRAIFWRSSIGILSQIDEKYFAPKTWDHTKFEFLWDIDASVISRHDEEYECYDDKTVED